MAKGRNSIDIVIGSEEDWLKLSETRVGELWHMPANDRGFGYWCFSICMRRSIQAVFIQMAQVNYFGIWMGSDHGVDGIRKMLKQMVFRFAFENRYRPLMIFSRRFWQSHRSFWLICVCVDIGTENDFETKKIM